MEKKYKLTEESISFNGKTLYRIEALKDFAEVKKGQKGGFIESEYNLSHECDAWVYYNAKVFGNAEVSGNAKVFGNSWVFDNAKVTDNVRVYDSAIV